MTIIDGTKQCPECGRYPKFTIMGKGSHNNRWLEYGLVCSNSECSWNRFSIMYKSRDKAIAEWNKKVMRHQESETNSPWHTGIPKEEGEYLCWVVFPEIICKDTEGSWKCIWEDSKWYENQYEGKLLMVEDLGAKIIAWQKITPYEEN